MSHAADSELPAGFAVTVGEPQGGIVEVSVVGAVDLMTAPPVADALERAQQGARAVRLDLRAVEFLGSAGLSVLVDAARRADESDGRFAILATEHAVLRAMQVTGLDEVLQVFEESGAADAYLAG